MTFGVSTQPLCTTLALKCGRGVRVGGGGVIDPNIAHFATVRRLVSAHVVLALPTVESSAERMVYCRRAAGWAL